MHHPAVKKSSHESTPEALGQFSVILGSERTKDALVGLNEYAIEECEAAYGLPKAAAI
ncbi:MAG TPA: hypothetical protein VFG71_11955 [Nitrospiraceae bacterium]|nr:hypothetical protein [Nitrospiraceae bacterium]